MTRCGNHVYWTRPRRLDERPFSDFEACALAVSCVTWKACNGPIKLFTDPQGRDQIGEMGLIGFWDEIDTNLLCSIPSDIQADAFWDFSKTWVIGQLRPSDCVLDLDLIVWRTLNFATESPAWLHWERPVEHWYPREAGLSRPLHYEFDASIDWDAPVANTAFMVAGSDAIRRKFLAEALRFARGNRPLGTGICEMLFAGQRLLPHVVRSHCSSPTTLVDHLFDPSQPHTLGQDPLALYAFEQGCCFTHLWRHKWSMLQNKDKAEHFIEWLICCCETIAPGNHRRLNLARGA
jgi:hypothetical protein